MIRKLMLTLSLGLLLATLVLWVRSYFVHEFVVYNSPARMVHIVSGHGYLWYKGVVDPHGPVSIWVDQPVGRPLPYGYMWAPFSTSVAVGFRLSDGQESGWQFTRTFAGRFVGFYDKRATKKQIFVEASFALPAAGFALYPSAVLIRGLLRRRNRVRKGLCVRCGYNLTGNVSGVCPECGQSTEDRS